MEQDDLAPMALRCAGLDIAKDEVVACVRILDVATGKAAVELASFGATTRQLLALRYWLESHKVTLVGMESTGTYWRAPYYLLEDSVEVWLLNARAVKGCPGRRKTDAKDAQWIARVTQYGLVQPSFVPPRPIRLVRTLTRYRRAQIEERTREAQRLDGVLQDAGIKLSSVASESLGVSGRAMLQALAGGTRDPQVLAELARGRLRAKIPQLAEALCGRFDDNHALVIASILAKINFLDGLIADLDTKIDEAIRPFMPVVDLLVTIPGINHTLAVDLIAEIGVDMSVWPSAAHLASWAKVAPGQHESAHKNKSGKTGQGPTWLDQVLLQAARSATRTKDTYLAAHYARLRGCIGYAKAHTALAHTLLMIAYHVIDRREPYHDLGPDYYQRRFNPEREVRRHTRELERLGYTVTLEPAA
jgi:transposase